MNVQQFRGLESDPEAFTNFIRKGGVKNLSFHELFSLDDLSFIPQPVVALILLYPDVGSGGELIFDTSSTSVAQQEQIYFMKQHNVGNACGTIAVIHSIANNVNSVEFIILIFLSLKNLYCEESFLKEFIINSKTTNPIEKCESLASNKNIFQASDACAREGQTTLSEPGDALDYHYICFTKVKDIIYELDGVKPGPLPVMKSNDESFLQDVVQHIKQNYIEKAGGKIQFNIVALGPNLD